MLHNKGSRRLKISPRSGPSKAPDDVHKPDTMDARMVGVQQGTAVHGQRPVWLREHQSTGRGELGVVLR